MPRFTVGERVCRNIPNALFHMTEGTIIEIIPPSPELAEFEYLIDFTSTVAIFAEDELSLSRQSTVN